MEERERILVEWEEAALEGARAIKAFLVYQGHNREYFLKARTGGTAGQVYSRIRATKSHEESLRQRGKRTENK